jgi:rRNA maturation endonuclease Nob1
VGGEKLLHEECQQMEVGMNTSEDSIHYVEPYCDACYACGVGVSSIDAHECNNCGSILCDECHFEHTCYDESY